MIISSILVIAFLIFFVFLPVKFLLNLFEWQFSSDPLIDLGLTLIVGIMMLVSISIVFQFISGTVSFIWILPLGSIIFLVKSKKSISKSFGYKKIRKISKAYSSFMILIIIASLLQAFSTFNMPRSVENGVYYAGLHDNLWNISIIGELIRKFPPDNPAISGFVLKNHHYFFLYFVALMHKITAIDIFILYYRFAPALCSILFGLGLYAVSSIFIKRKMFILLSIFLGYFSGNLSYILPLFIKGFSDWKGSTFYADQPFDQIFNPYTIFSYASYLLGAYLLSKLTVGQKISFKWIMVMALIFGSLFAYKSFAGILAILSLFGAVVLHFAATKNKSVLLLIVFAAAFFIPHILLISDMKNSLVFMPGWLLTEMMTAKDKLNLPEFASIENYYFSINNYFGLAKIKFYEFLIYLFGNLGMRILGLVSLLILIFKKKARNRVILPFIILTVFFSFFIPLFFNLKVTSHNIIQFSPYSFVLLSVFAGVFLEMLYEKIKLKRFLPLTLILIVILTTMPSTIKNISEKLNGFFKTPDNLSEIVSYDELEILEYIKKNTPTGSKIMIYPQQFLIHPISKSSINRSSIFTSALTARSIYLSDPSLAVQSGVDPEERLQKINKFFSSGMEDKNFVHNEGIDYIYLIRDGKFNNSNIAGNNYIIEKENASAILLRVNQEDI